MTGRAHRGETGTLRRDGKEGKQRLWMTAGRGDDHQYTHGCTDERHTTCQQPGTLAAVLVTIPSRGRPLIRARRHGGTTAGAESGRDAPGKGRARERHHARGREIGEHEM